METYWMPLLGGMLVGLALAIPLWAYGYAEGASGMIQGLVSGSKERRRFRLVLDGSMALTGLACALIEPSLFEFVPERPLLAFAAAGLLVGFGAKRANGCPSGHGVIGVGRGSLRSIVALTLFTAVATIVGSLLWQPSPPTLVESASAADVPAHLVPSEPTSMETARHVRVVDSCHESVFAETEEVRCD